MMIQKIIDFSIHNKLVVALFVVGLISWGSYEVTRLPIDAVPDITDNQVQVITVSPSLGAPDIERLITFPIEQASSNIPGIKQIRSFSRFGLSLVTIVFDEETDVYWARQQISERLQQVQQELPAGIGSPQMAPVSTGLGEIYQYVVRPKAGYEGKYDAMQLRTIQDWIVRRQLLGTPGVAEVASFGGNLKQYEIAVQQNQLKAHGLTITDVFGALEKNNENTGGAYIEKGPTVLYIRSEGLTRTLTDIENIVVKNLENGTPLLMRDVAVVQYGSAIRYGAMTFNDKGEVAGAVVMMLKGENSSAVVKAVKARIVEIQKMLPEGVVIEPFLDRTKMVNNAISTVETNLAEGALIVIFVLVFFLGNFRAGLIVSSVIPLSMLFAIILMNEFGVGGNLMSLGAIDFGLIVDGSVIVVEAILHRFTHAKQFRGITRISQQEMNTEVSKSSGAMIKSAAFSQIIILIVYLPILSLEGIEGKMFKPMAYTISFAILGAFILSLTYVPMMSALFLKKKLNHDKTWSDKLIIWLERKYQPLLGKVLGYPKTIIATTLALFIISIVILSRMGGEFMPQLEEGDFAVETRLLTGSNLNNTINATQKASKILIDRFPEVEKVVTKIGSAEIPTDPMPFEAGDMMVILKDKKDWTSAKGFTELSEKMTEALEEIPGITVGFQFPVQMRFNELMTGARQDVVCKIFGENLDTLTHYAGRLASIIKTVDGAISIYEEKMTGMPQVIVKYNRHEMSKYGLNVEDVNRIVNTAFAGQVAGQVYEGEKRFDLVVRLAGTQRKNVSDISNLMIPTVQGTQLPLSAIAEIEETEGVNQVQRENTRRRIIVGFNVSGRDVQSIVEELQSKVNTQLHLPREYTIHYGGSFENMSAAKDRLSIVVPVALLLIFLLLYFAFGSVKQGLLIYTAIPLSAIGGVLALWVRDMPFSISAGIGFIALFGVAVLNGILLVSEFNRLKKEGWHDVRRIVVHATKSKLRAVLMTALVPSLGFIPMAISTGAGGEVQKPLATVVIGGLMVSTFLTLFVLPILYILFEKGVRYFTRPGKTVFASLLLIMASVTANAQEKIELHAAVDSALNNNGRMRIAATDVEYYRLLKRSGTDIEKTHFGVEYGKFNSVVNDNRFMISQQIEFPTVYRHQKNINKINLALSETERMGTEREVKLMVKQTFYDLVVMQQKLKLLRDADSLYSLFSDKTKQRFDAGETDVLEQSTAENQRVQIANQLQLLNSEYGVLMNELRVLMNSAVMKEPVSDEILYRLPLAPGDSIIANNPYLRREQQQTELALEQRKLERSRMLPSLNAGYNNATITGWHSPDATTEKYYDHDKRFSSVSVGIGIPLFSSAQRARIRASEAMIKKQEQEVAYVKQQLETSLQNAIRTYKQYLRSIDTYHSILLPNAKKSLDAAQAKLNAGEIDFIQWVIMVNQAISVRNEYFDVAGSLNGAAFEIELLSGEEIK